MLTDQEFPKCQRLRDRGVKSYERRIEQCKVKKRLKGDKLRSRKVIELRLEDAYRDGIEEVFMMLP